MKKFGDAKVILFRGLEMNQYYCYFLLTRSCVLGENSYNSKLSAHSQNTFALGGGKLILTQPNTKNLACIKPALIIHREVVE